MTGATAQRSPLATGTARVEVSPARRRGTAPLTKTGPRRRDLARTAVLTVLLSVVKGGGHLIADVHHAISLTIGDQTWCVVQFPPASAVPIGP